ncbi:hypothetical protein ONZ45_g14763 [Pleurotus djamor]|nr:hypothetical protein ONZ45_g14763 [Pleurotus djamor]
MLTYSSSQILPHACNKHTGGAVFNPDSMRNRDKQQLSSSVQLSQLTALQNEAQEYRARIKSLQDRLHAKTTQADRAKTS